MTAPTVQSRTASVSSTSNSTSFTPTLPGTINTGDLLIAFVAADGSPTLSTTSTGWTSLQNGASTNPGNDVTGWTFYKIATASNTLVVNSTASEQYSAIIYRITLSGGGGVRIIARTAEGSSTNSTIAEPYYAPSPSLALTSMVADWLFIAARMGDSTVVATAAPFGYSNLTTQAGGGANGASINAADKTEASYDIGVDASVLGSFTSATEQWVTVNVLVADAVANTKTLTRSSTPVGTFAKVLPTNKAVSAVTTPVATLVRQAEKVISASASGVATIVKSIGKPRTATTTPTGSILKAIAKAFSSASTLVATMTKVFAGGGTTYNQAVSASGTGVGSYAYTLTRGVTAAISASGVGTISRAIAKTITRTATGSASIVRDIAKTITRTASGVGTFTNLTVRSAALTASTTAVATLSKVIAAYRTLTASSGLTVAVTKAMARAISGSVSGVATDGKARLKTLTASASVSVRLRRIYRAYVAPVLTVTKQALSSGATVTKGLLTAGATIIKGALSGGASSVTKDDLN